MGDGNEKCPICNIEVKSANSMDPLNKRFSYDCPRCRKYTITEEARDTLTEPVNAKLSGWVREQNELGRSEVRVDCERVKEVNSSLPDYGVLDKQFLLLKNIARRSKHPGWEVSLNPLYDASLAWADSEEEFMYYVSELYARGYLRSFEQSMPPVVVISSEGWEYLDKHKTCLEERTQVFVAMSFSRDLNRVWEEAIKPAITKAGYKAYRIDYEPHNKRIDAKIMSEIKNSRFVVADFTENKHGVYFEAGYALGLHTPVIWCVRKTDLADLHFDTRQYGHIAWETEAELREKLYDYICAIIGKR